MSTGTTPDTTEIARLPRILISYSHDGPEHVKRVHHLSATLRKHGIDSRIDAYEPAPSEGWPRWMDRNIMAADFVLIIISERYASRWNGNEEADKGFGVSWESDFIRNDLYHLKGENKKYIPILFTANDRRWLMTRLFGYPHYQLGNLSLEDDDEYRRLYGHLTGDQVIRPELGKIQQLPPQSTLPVSSYAAIDTGTMPQKKELEAIWGYRLDYFRHQESAAQDSLSQQALRELIDKTERQLNELARARRRRQLWWLSGAIAVLSVLGFIANVARDSVLDAMAQRIDWQTSPESYRTATAVPKGAKFEIKITGAKERAKITWGKSTKAKIYPRKQDELELECTTKGQVLLSFTVVEGLFKHTENIEFVVEDAF